jgi:hypothetical protein
MRLANHQSKGNAGIFCKVPVDALEGERVRWHLAHPGALAQEDAHPGRQSSSVELEAWPRCSRSFRQAMRWARVTCRTSPERSTLAKAVRV